MKIFASIKSISTALLAALLIVGCANKAAQPEKAESIAPATAAAAPAPAKEAKKDDNDKNTAKVIGINGQEGEVIGTPSPTSKFKSLQIGMSARQASDIAGQPNDSGSYITGKAWIPFYFGNDRYRFEYAYKGNGRLIFAGSSAWGGWGSTQGRLIKIIHDKNDSGYR
ncbi:MAG: hypothetical protein Q7K57_32295 [Burkholderiaceae bacterium]|nr:hypothetical protein [Burkholderiaceae bacterium]